MVMKERGWEPGPQEPERPAAESFEPIETVDLVGGALCLDFVNTGSSRRVGPFRERLQDYEDLVVWAGRVGLLEPRDAAALHAQAARRPAEATRVLERAWTLREAIYRIFSAHARGNAPPQEDVEELNRMLADGGRMRRVQRVPHGWVWTWDRADETLAWPLWPVAQSAAELLTETDAERIKECGSENCNWLFYDASKNRSRRWCEMSDCGNRAKQRRHRHRTSASPDAPRSGSPG
jgi:predicted RNA-binding Zn ribbon-like protein